MSSVIKVEINAKGFVQGKDDLKKDLLDVANKAKEVGAQITGALSIKVGDQLKGSIDSITGAFIPFQEQLTYTDKQLKAHEGIVENAGKAQKGYTDQITGQFIPAQEKATKSTSALSSVIGDAATQFAILYGARKVVGFLADSVEQSVKLENALIGVRTVAKSFKQDIGATEQAVKNFTKDGLVSATEAALAFKQILSTGTALPDAIKLLNSLKDSAAFNRQAFYSVGEAIVATTEGIKNGNSVRADAVGVTKNLSVLEKEYAASLGRTIGSLSDAEKIQARVNGFIREGGIFAGDAAKLTDTYAGAVSKLGVAYDQLRASIGSFVTGSKGVSNFISNITGLFETFTTALGGDKQSQIEDLRKELTKLAESGLSNSPIYKTYAESLQKLSDATKQVGTAGEGDNSGFRRGQAEFLKLAKDGAEQVSAETLKQRKELSEQLKYAGLSDLEEAKKRRDEGIALAGEDGALKKQIILKFNDDVKAINNKASKSLVTEAKKSAQEIRAEIKNAFQVRDEFGEGFKNPFDVISGSKLTQTLATKIREQDDITQALREQYNKSADGSELQKKLGQQIGQSDEIQKAYEKQMIEATKNLKFGGALGAFGAILQGGAGAQALITGAGKAFANTLVPGLGEAVGPILDALQKGPDAVRQQVKEFAEALPVLLENIALAIPAVIEELANQLPIIIQKLADAMPVVARELAAQSPYIAIEVSKAMAFEMPRALLKAAPDMGKAFSVALVQGAGDFLKAITSKATGGASNVLSAGGSGSFFKDIGAAAKGEVLGSLVGGPVGAAAGALGGFFGKFKFASGVEIKKAKGGVAFQDSVPSLLQEGEVVLDRNASRKFEEKMDNQEGNAKVISLLAKLVDMSKMTQTQPINVQIGSREIVKAFYDMKRNGERFA